MIGSLLLAYVLPAQPTRKADNWYARGAYYKALQEYGRLLSGFSRLPEQGYIEFQAGKCCMKMTRYHHALEWFEKAEKDGYSGEDLWRQLGEAYLISGRYMEAKTYFARCHQSDPNDKSVLTKMASCDFARQSSLVNSGLKIVPLPYLNTRGSEYGIALFPGGLLYSSTGDLLPEKKKEISQRTGLGYSCPYLSVYRDGDYQPGLLLGTIRRPASNDGAFGYDWTTDLLYYTRCEEGDVNCRILFARLKNNSYRVVGELKPGKRERNIAHPFITEGGNRIYFSSTMSGGFGGADIWYMIRQPDGKWSDPLNAGPVVNSEGNEVFPYVWSTTLYFASDGRVGYGGLDLYRAEIIDGGFEEPRNMGPGINTSYDDFNIVLEKDGRSGMLVSNRLPDRSDEIYRFENLKMEQQSVLSQDLRDTFIYVSEMLDLPVQEIELKDTADHRSGRIYRMEVAKGDVSHAGWWVQVAMLMKSKIIGYDLASRVTELTGRRVVMYKGKDGGHRFYIGVYEDEHEARKVMVTLRLTGIDCFVKRVMPE